MVIGGILFLAAAIDVTIEDDGKTLESVNGCH
jgi:hypothetical protein